MYPLKICDGIEIIEGFDPNEYARRNPDINVYQKLLTIRARGIRDRDGAITEAKQTLITNWYEAQLGKGRIYWKCLFSPNVIEDESLRDIQIGWCGWAHPVSRSEHTIEKGCKHGHLSETSTVDEWQPIETGPRKEGLT